MKDKKQTCKDVYDRYHKFPGDTSEGRVLTVLFSITQSGSEVKGLQFLGKGVENDLSSADTRRFFVVRRNYMPGCDGG